MNLWSNSLWTPAHAALDRHIRKILPGLPYPTMEKLWTQLYPILLNMLEKDISRYLPASLVAAAVKLDMKENRRVIQCTAIPISWNKWIDEIRAYAENACINLQIEPSGNLAYVRVDDEFMLSSYLVTPSGSANIEHITATLIQIRSESKFRDMMSKNFSPVGWVPDAVYGRYRFANRDAVKNIEVVELPAMRVVHGNSPREISDLLHSFAPTGA